MEAFYVLATEDYRQLALAADWPALLAGRATLLDVACGSGKFPTALRTYADLPPEPAIAYDLLDPSAFSIAEARAALRPAVRARPRARGDPAGPPRRPDLRRGVGDPRAVRRARRPSWPPPPSGSSPRSRPAGSASSPRPARPRTTWPSTTPTAPGSRRPPGVDAFTSGEQVRDALVAAGADVREERVHYTSGTDDDAVAEGFLQRCAFDDSVTPGARCRPPRCSATTSPAAAATTDDGPSSTRRCCCGCEQRQASRGQPRGRHRGRPGRATTSSGGTGTSPWPTTRRPPVRWSTGPGLPDVPAATDEEVADAAGHAVRRARRGGRGLRGATPSSSCPAC